MTIQGYQFDKCKVTPEADAALYYQLNNKQNHVIAGYKNEMNVTSSGLNVYVDTGCALVMGRYCEITNQEQLSVMANTEGYVCITIDLTETNTAEGVPGSADYVVTNNQLRVELVTELVQQDLFNDGQVFTFPLASFNSNGTSITLTKNKFSYPPKNGIVIFEGGHTFTDGAKYYFDLSKMKKGLIITWSRYTPGSSPKPEDYGYLDTLIPVETIEVLAGKARWIGMPTLDAIKQVRVFTDYITGVTDNAVQPNSNYGLRRIIAI